MPPWLIDRILRNLLIDVTGNTHRAEFCIDKLYSPDGATGRLGLLEMRAFEMPPHARMSLAQQLLLRALIARFWRQPYRPAACVAGAPNCTTASCCRTSCGRISPTSSTNCARRLSVEAAGSRRTSSSASRSWATSRPAASSRTAHGARALARDGRGRRAGGTVRYVDSSVERVQVKVRGWSTTATCSPATAVRCRCSRTGRIGEFVAGVRYRAWQPPSCLHPTIGVHAPLTFDLVDTLDAAVDGRLPVSRRAPRRAQLRDVPGQCLRGRGRRLARFFRIGHTPGAMHVVDEPRNPDHFPSRSTCGALFDEARRPAARAYPPALDRFDELFESRCARVRRTGADGVDVGARQIGEPPASAERQIRENGITYNVYADPQGPRSALGARRSAAAHSAGRVARDRGRGRAARPSAQRDPGRPLRRADTAARGLRAPRTGVRSRGFLRAAHGAPPCPPACICIYAADLARAPDGRWWVLADRTQAPSGRGVRAREPPDRVARVPRALPRPAASSTRRRSSRPCAIRSPTTRRRRRARPVRTVLLTPGPYNETYFEHALLARYLGFPLVEGGDLTVRDGPRSGSRRWTGCGVCMRSCAGSTTTTAIRSSCAPTRRSVCPGWSTARAGTVLMANALGSGVLESGALLGFLPASPSVCSARR
jgi:hypothetical protein